MNTPPPSDDLLDTSSGSNEPAVVSVAELSGAVKRTVEDRFAYVRVRGEISGFKRAASGHLYMSLKDPDAVIDAVCWRGSAGRLDVVPEDGLEVIATGRITTYAQRSKYQLVIERMEAAGEGALLKMIEERRRRLAAEGLFDAERKRPLPYLPEVVGVVTSPTGAVIRDILHRLADRFPRRVLLWPVLVQGNGAAEQVAAAIEGFNRLAPDGAVPRPDVLIVARGGGSLEDLMAFNEEVVVRAAAASAIPLISAVGHETDTTLIDFASDRRAPTPTAAAEMAVPVRGDLVAQLAEHEARLTGAMARLLRARGQEVNSLGRGLPEPRRLLESAMQRVDDWAERLADVMPRLLRARSEEVAQMGRQMVRPEQYVLRKREALAARLGRLEGARTGTQRTIRREVRDVQALAGRLQQCGGTYLKGAEGRLDSLGKLLESYSYKGVLERGFALVRDSSGEPVLSAGALTAGDAISIAFRDDGRVEAQVTSVGGGTSPAPVGGRPKARAKPKSAQKPSSGQDPQGSLL